MTDKCGVDIWLEPDVVIRWWNPLTWLARLSAGRSHRWHAMMSVSPHGHCYIMSTHRKRRRAEKARDLLRRIWERCERTMP